MKPSQIARALRVTANRIESRVASKRQLTRGQVASSISGILRHVAGEDWSHLQPLDAKGAQSSQLLWHAMAELGMEDWQPDTNIDDVTEKMKGLAASVGVTDIQEAMKYALENFDDYHAHYNPEAPPEGEAMDR